MSRKSVNFGDKKIQKSSFYKNEKIYKIDGINVNKILVSKKEPYGKNNQSNISLNIMMMLLDRYV